MFETDLFDSGRSLLPSIKVSHRFMALILMISGLGFSLFSLALSIWQINFKFNQPVLAEVPAIPLASDSAKIWIDIGGAVKKPGLYPLDQGDRLARAIKAAGGFSHAADKYYLNQQLNLAQELKDGQKIYIPTKADSAVTRRVQSSSNQTVTEHRSSGSGNASVLIDQTQQAKQTSAQRSLQQSQTRTDQKNEPQLISLNHASQVDLERLTGVGEVRALKIIQHRPYDKLDELVSKKVISEKIFQQNLAKLTL